MRDRLISAAVLFSIGYAITFLAGWWFPWTSIVVGVLLLVATGLALFDADIRAGMGVAGFLGFAVFGFLLFRSGRAELRHNAAITAEVKKIGQQINLAETTLAQGQIDDAIRLCVELEPKVSKDQKARLEQVKARAENRIMQRTGLDVWKLIESEDFATAEAKIRAVLNEPEATRRESASKLLETILLEIIFKEREKVANKKLADIVAEAQAEFNAGRIPETEKLLNQAQGLAHATELGDLNQLKVNVEAAIRDEQLKKEELARQRQREKPKREEEAVAGKRPTYTVVKMDDISLKALTKRLSEYTPGEVARLPLNKRMRYEIFVPSDMSAADLKTAMIHLVNDKSGRDPDIDEIAVFAYREDDVGRNHPYGKLQWCPNGNWAGMTPEIARSNDRSTYKFIFEILGITKEEHERLAKAAAMPADANVIGRWMDNESAFPGVLTFSKEGGKVIKTRTFADGSSGKYEMLVRTVKNQVRYIRKDDPDGDYWIVTPNGDLSWGDAEEGIWATSKKIK